MINMTSTLASRPRGTRPTVGTVATATVLTLAALIAAPATAWADTSSPSPSTYAAVNPTLTVSTGSIVEGGHVTVSGSGYTAGETVDLKVVYGPKPQAAGVPSAHPASVSVAFRQALIARADANAGGTFTDTVVLTHTGMATITGTGETSKLTSSATVDVRPSTVVGSASSSQHGLFANRDVMIAVGAGVLALLLGAGGFFLVRRRKLGLPLPLSA
jgi:hypothetical protein